MGNVNLLQGDCLNVLRTLASNSIDSVVTDPPYGISFMNKKWDYDVPSVGVWKECLRVLKPGGHILVACGTRTQHRMVAPIEDAGFEIRDVITWLYGSGFPKSLDVGKAIDKEAGAERDKIKVSPRAETSGTFSGKTDTRPWIEAARERGFHEVAGNTPITDAAKQWSGFGTAIKPAVEFWTLCRKPLSESTVAKNVLKWDTGGINVDGTRIVSEATSTTQGRFPANLILDEEAAVALDEQTGNNESRFFYCAKSSKSDRGEGNGHPTVKPTKLMEYLCRLITPPGGTVLDPFMGSGSTGVGALKEGFNFIGIELSEGYFEICKTRLVVKAEEESDIVW